MLETANPASGIGTWVGVAGEPLAQDKHASRVDDGVEREGVVVCASTPGSKQESAAKGLAEVLDRNLVIKGDVVTDRYRSGVDTGGLERIMPWDEAFPIGRVAMNEEDATGGHGSGGKRWERDRDGGVPTIVVKQVFEKLLDAQRQLRSREKLEDGAEAKCSGPGRRAQVSCKQKAAGKIRADFSLHPIPLPDPLVGPAVGVELRGCYETRDAASNLRRILPRGDPYRVVGFVGFNQLWHSGVSALWASNSIRDSFTHCHFSFTQSTSPCMGRSKL